MKLSLLFAMCLSGYKIAPFGAEVVIMTVHVAARPETVAVMPDDVEFDEAWVGDGWSGDEGRKTT